MSQFEALCQQLQQRLGPLDELKIAPSGGQQAAVVLILRERSGEAEILIIKRAENPHDPWSGHLALPGGRVESGDTSLLAAAVRETREEVGIDLASGGQFLGRLDTVWPGNPRLPQIAITPVVALAPPGARMQLNVEVDEAFWLSLPMLKQRGRTEIFRLDLQGLPRTWPAYPSPAGPIWGITERILTQLLSLLD